jgi:hypothetical protein
MGLRSRARLSHPITSHCAGSRPERWGLAASPLCCEIGVLPSPVAVLRAFSTASLLLDRAPYLNSSDPWDAFFIAPLRDSSHLHNDGKALKVHLPLASALVSSAAPLSRVCGLIASDATYFVNVTRYPRNPLALAPPE